MKQDDLKNDVYANRDVHCADDVATMAILGRFGDQFIVYGTAMNTADGSIYYRVTANEKKLYDYVDAKRAEEVYCTPIVSFQKRSQVPSGEEDKILLAAKYALLSQMKNSYESVDFFNRMSPFFQTKANNAGYPLLCKYRDSIDGNYDDLELQLLEGAMKIAYEGKILDHEHYSDLQRWVQKTRLQMEDEPVVEENLGRTLYGFVYWKNGRADCIFDAQETSVIRQRIQKMLQGYIAGPVVKRDYWFQQFVQFREIRKNHSKWLMAEENQEYYQLINQMKKLSGVIDSAALETVRQAVSGSEHALSAVNYYDSQWNKL